MGKNKIIRYGYAPREIPADAAESRVVPFTISTGARDRHHTVISPEKWQLDNYMRNPIVGYMHSVWGGGLCSDPNPDMVIGKAVETLIVESVLKSAVHFEEKEINELAEKVFRKVLFGSLNMSSVGFLEVGTGCYGKEDEAEGRENETYYFDGQELVEWSIVNIPSNPEAGARKMRALRDEAVAGFLYAFKELGGKFRFSQIEEMRVRDILDLLDGKDIEINETDPEKVREKLGDPGAKAAMLERQQAVRKHRLHGLNG